MLTIKHAMQEWPANASGVEAGPSTGEPPVWSHCCGWGELAVPFAVDSAARAGLDLGPGWVNRWSAVWRSGGAEVTRLLRDLVEIPVAGCEPVRRFSWRAGQRHRPGLLYMVTTGRHHGFESLEEARLLLVLDFTADLVDVVSQPFRLQFTTRDGPRAHTPDFLALTAAGTWLIDVRPAGRVRDEDLPGFTAATEAALLCGWRYAIVTGWLANAAMTLDTLSSQRRKMADPLLVQPTLLQVAADGPRAFGELVEETAMPPIARAHLLHLLWHRRLSIDLAEPLSDRTLVWPVRGTA